MDADTVAKSDDGHGATTGAPSAEPAAGGAFREADLETAIREVRDLATALNKPRGTEGSRDCLNRAAKLALGHSETEVDFNPLLDDSVIPEMMTYLRDSKSIDQMGGQSQLWWSFMFHAWVVTWRFRSDSYESMSKGDTINGALCRAVVAVAAGAAPSFVSREEAL